MTGQALQTNPSNYLTLVTEKIFQITRGHSSYTDLNLIQVTMEPFQEDGQCPLEVKREMALRAH